MSIDRIDPNGHYEPKNCRWADKATQAINTRRCWSRGPWSIGPLRRTRPSYVTASDRIRPIWKAS